MNQPSMATGQDVVDYLIAQHREIERMLDEVLSSHGSERAEAFTALRRTLAVHETAEEEIVHPQAKHTLDLDEVVSARLSEEHDGKQMLAELEELDVDSEEFEAKYRQLRIDVLDHAKAEEQQEFGRLSAELDEKQLTRMRQAAELAERTAPTRPHAGVESGSANLLVGPFAAMMDRTRDALRGKAG